MKKLLAILVAACMAAGLVPAMASAAAPQDPNGFSCWSFNSYAGIDKDGSGTYNGGSWSWVQSTKTLTLTNISHTTSDYCALSMPDDATIVLNGSNTIASTYSGELNSTGLWGDGNLTIAGNGSLSVKGGTSTGGGSYGLATNFGITISANADVTAAGGSSNFESYGVSTSFNISGGSLTATGDSSAIRNTFFVPAGYTYWVNGAKAAPGGAGIVSGGDFAIDSTYKYAKIAASAASAAPTLTGPASLSLAEGYAAASTGVYTITGYPAPTVTKTSGEAKITWNAATRKLDIAAGLAAGTYAVTLKASNGVSPDATLTFTLTIKPPTSPKTIFSTGRAATFLNWFLFIVCFGWIWMWF